MSMSIEGRCNPRNRNYDRSSATLWTMVLIVTSSFWTVGSSECTSQEEDISLSFEQVTAEVSEVPGKHFFVAKATTKPQICGEYCYFRIRIDNPSPSRPIEISKLQTSCACRKLLLEIPVIDVGEYGTISGGAKIPRNSNADKFEFLVRLDSHDSPISQGGTGVGVLKITIPLKSNLWIDQSVRTFHVTPEAFGSWSLPVVFSEPIKFSNLTCRLSDKASELTASLKEKAGGVVFVQLEAPPHAIKETGLFGTLTVQENVSGRSVSLDFVVAQKPVVSVIPTLITFRPEQALVEKELSLEQENPKRYASAVVFIRCANKNVGKIKNVSVEPDRPAEKKIKVQVSVSEKTPVLFQVDLRVDLDDINSFEKLNWSVTTSNKVSRVSTPIRFSSVPR